MTVTAAMFSGDLKQQLEAAVVNRPVIKQFSHL